MWSPPANGVELSFLGATKGRNGALATIKGRVGAVRLLSLKRPWPGTLPLEMPHEMRIGLVGRFLGHVMAAG